MHCSWECELVYCYVKMFRGRSETLKQEPPYDLYKTIHVWVYSFFCIFLKILRQHITKILAELYLSQHYL